MTGPWIWHEYPVSRRGELALAAGSTIAPFGIGLAAALALVFAFVLPGEEGLLRIALIGAGVDPDAARTAVKGVDFVGRVGVGMLAAAAALAGIAALLAREIADEATGRALLAAAEAGAPRRLVPAPQQVERVVRRGSSALEHAMRVIGWTCIGIAVLIILVAISEGFDDALIVALIGFGLGAALLAGFRHRRRIREPQRRERQRRIAAHWRPGDEAAAWEHARSHGESSSGGGLEGRHRLVQLGRILDRAAISGLMAVPVLMHVVVWLRYPDAVRVSPSRWEFGRAAELTGEAAELFAVVQWGFSLLLVVAVVLPAIGAVLRIIGAAAERRRLHRDLADPAAPRPPSALLVHHAERRGEPLAQLLAAAAGVGLALGPAVLILAGLDSYEFPRADAIFAPFQPAALATTLIALVLLGTAVAINAERGARGRELRNRLLHRWPTLPEQGQYDEEQPSPRHGPALSA